MVNLSYTYKSIVILVQECLLIKSTSYLDNMVIKLQEIEQKTDRIIKPNNQFLIRIIEIVKNKRKLLL